MRAEKSIDFEAKSETRGLKIEITLSTSEKTSQKGGKFSSNYSTY